jgi:hypothetical protein
MPEISMRAGGDARDEQFQPSGSSATLSPNLQAIYDDLDTGKLAEWVRLADRIESGYATESEAEHEVLYEAFPRLVARVQDLADMCRRREEALGEAGVQVGRVPA